MFELNCVLLFSQRCTKDDDDAVKIYKYITQTLNQLYRTLLTKILNLLAGRRERHPACTKLGIGLLVVNIL